jgi:hypothetical protein
MAAKRANNKIISGSVLGNGCGGRGDICDASEGGGRHMHTRSRNAPVFAGKTAPCGRWLAQGCSGKPANKNRVL